MWTQRKPEIPGWYWKRDIGATFAVVVCVAVMPGGHLADVYQGVEIAADEGNEWSGPLFPPEFATVGR